MASRNLTGHPFNGITAVVFENELISAWNKSRTVSIIEQTVQTHRRHAGIWFVAQRNTLFKLLDVAQAVFFKEIGQRRFGGGLSVDGELLV